MINIYIVGDWIADGVQSVDMRSFLDSVVITNKSIVRRIRVSPYEIYKTHWHNGEISLDKIKIINFCYHIFMQSYKICFYFITFLP